MNKIILPAVLMLCAALVISGVVYVVLLATVFGDHGTSGFNPSAFPKITVGMSVDEVRQILGEPGRKRTDPQPPHLERWTYLPPGSWLPDKMHVVVMENGVVVKTYIDDF